jgi:hypothetical protein
MQPLQSAPLTSASDAGYQDVTLEKPKDSPFGQSEFHSAPSTKKAAPFLAA